MNSTAQLLLSSRNTMTKSLAVWLPPFLISAMQLMAAGPYENDVARFVVLGTATLGRFIIDAGWFTLIREASNDRPARMEEFKTGVNGYWVPLVLGNLAFYLVLLALLGGMVAIGSHAYGLKGLESWFLSVEKLPPEQLKAALQIQRVPLLVQNWLALLTGWFALGTLAAFLLLFWEPIVVVRGVSWWRAWGGSAKLVLRRFPQTIAIVILQGLTMGSSLMVMVAGEDSPIAAMLGLGMLLTMMTFFKVVYTTLVADAWPSVIDARA